MVQKSQKADSPSSSTRLGWMDMLRGLAVVLVAVFHIQYPLAERVPQTPDTLLLLGEAVEPFRMPLLFFLSGLLLPVSLGKSPAAYLGGKLRSLVWPFVLWTVVVAVTFREFHWLGQPQSMVEGIHHLWFLAVLVVCYAIAPLTRLVPAWVWPVPMVLLAPLVDYLHGERLLWYGAFFFTGAAVAAYVRTWQSVHWLIPSLMLGFTCVWGVLAASSTDLRKDHSIGVFPAALVGVLALVWFAPRLPRIRPLEWVGRGSMVVYLVNLTAITMCFQTIDMLEITNPWIITVTLVTAGLVVPVAMVPLNRTILFTWPRRQAPRDPVDREGSPTSGERTQPTASRNRSPSARNGSM